MRCHYCHKELPSETHGKRTYCNDAHKQAHYRQRVQQDQQDKAVLIDRIEQLSAQVQEQKEEIAQLERSIIQLKRQLDLEHRYLTDTQARGFIPFLKKHLSSPFTEKILNDRYLTSLCNQASRWTYERQLRFRLHCSDEELEEFKQLWQLMMLETYSNDL